MLKGMKPVTPILRFALCALAAGPLLARADDLPGNIIVRAMASRNYAPPASASSRARAATYLFFQGRFYHGAANDPSLEATPFAQIARTLAPDLARQGFLPTKDLRNADLLIVVDWGATIGQDNPDRLFQQQTLNDSFAALRTAPAGGQGQGVLGAADIANIIVNDQISSLEDISADLSMEGTAKLLGIKGQFEHAIKASFADANGKSTGEAEIDAELKQDRYFLVVRAFDYQAMTKTGKVGRPLWQTRINMPAEEMAFAQALPAMSRAAAALYGTRSPRPGGR
jgi:hypothetical protein